MDQKDQQKQGMGRRKIFPILGTGLLFSIIPSSARAALDQEKEEYQTLLKPDGTVVRVKSSSIKSSKKLRKNLTNSELFKWLNKNK